MLGTTLFRGFAPKKSQSASRPFSRTEQCLLFSRTATVMFRKDVRPSNILLFTNNNCSVNFPTATTQFLVANCAGFIGVIFLIFLWCRWDAKGNETTEHSNWSPTNETSFLVCRTKRIIYPRGRPSWFNFFVNVVLDLFSLFSPSSSVSLSYFIFDAPMLKRLGKHYCTSSRFLLSCREEGWMIFH